MSNFITMQRRLWRELDRTDITADAQAAIQTAINHYSSYRFWFNEQRWTGATIDGQEFYPMPPGFRDIDSFRVTINENDYPLIRRGWDELEDWAISPNTFKGFPTDYALYRNQIRLYPTPNGAYTLSLSGQTDLSGLSADATTNEWMKHGEEMIRSRAAADLLENILQDYDEPRSTLYRLRERDAFERLLAESNKRISTGRVRKARW